MLRTRHHNNLMVAPLLILEDPLHLLDQRGLQRHVVVADRDAGRDRYGVYVGWDGEAGRVGCEAAVD